jgi:hypothetical protein
MTPPTSSTTFAFCPCISLAVGWGIPSGRRQLLLILPAFVLLGGLVWAAAAPIQLASHDQLFEIPRGTFARHMKGEHVDTLPQTINLTLGLNDVLLFKNSDDVPHIFGPTLIMPGQSFRLPFTQASTYTFQCTAHPNGGLSVIVDPAPVPGWRRLSWRWRKLTNAA